MTLNSGSFDVSTPYYLLPTNPTLHWNFDLGIKSPKYIVDDVEQRGFSLNFWEKMVHTPEESGVV